MTIILLILLLYFMPSLIAILRGHRNAGSIIVINLFFGWSIAGWVIALAMSVSASN